jgi:ribose-phosphate pyrophosphokinase
MMTPVELAMPGNELLAGQLSNRLGSEHMSVQVRRFPDGESYVRIEGSVAQREALIVCTLDRPDDKLVPLLLLACAVHEAGTKRVGLVAPYLAYMRQDKIFKVGETISAQHFES